MDSKITNISKRIEELNVEIHKLEQQLAEMTWEREKYLQFSDNESEIANHSNR